MYNYENYDRPSYDEELYDKGYRHIDSLPDYDHIKDYLIGLVEAIYVDKDFDKIESCLEEILHQFKMDLPKSQTLDFDPKQYCLTKLYTR